MKRAIFLTAYDRPEYLREALESWKNVRGQENWHFVAMIEPSPVGSEVVQMFEEFLKQSGFPTYQILVNPQRYGVLHHPWVGFERLFMASNFDFVVRAEDDLRVSTDTLEYFEWASEQWQDNPSVATVNAFTYATHGTANDVQLCPVFSPLVWGTWRDRWADWMSRTWDHDYSTNNGTPMEQAGWDWNLNTRLFPQMGLHAAFPLASRVDNIGLVGTHSTPENYSTSDSFQLDHGAVSYRLVSDATLGR